MAPPSCVCHRVRVLPVEVPAYCVAPGPYLLGSVIDRIWTVCCGSAGGGRMQGRPAASSGLISFDSWQQLNPSTLRSSSSTSLSLSLLQLTGCATCCTSGTKQNMPFPWENYPNSTQSLTSRLPPRFKRLNFARASNRD
jgi:hypothetical protein